MEVIEKVILDVMCLFFPLAIYIIGIAYFRNQDCKKKEIFLEIALYSSVYLLIKFGSSITLIYPLILLNVPLLISYLKTNSRTVVILSIVLIAYYNLNTGIHVYYLILEYLLYFLIYKYLISNKSTYINIITMFVIVKSFIMSLEMSLIFNPENNIVINFVLIFTIMTIFTSIAYFILFFLNKGEEIMELNNLVHELEKEKKLRESLFKITHEIKNPIAVCKGYLDMIDYNDQDKIKRYIPIVKDEIARTLILMDDFLDYTKIQIEKDIVDLYLLLEETCDVVKPLFKKNHIKLELNIPSDEVYMELDYNRLKQVLVNILKNSIEAKDTKKDKNIVSITAEAKKDEVVIKIKDNGVGMDKKTLERVDEMFYTTKEKGTGLGVALSKEIINQHGGDIIYSSVKSKYTLVTITFPYKEKNY